MGKKKRSKSNSKIDSGTAQTNQGLKSFSEFPSGSKAKWLFFVIYLIVTIFLFRDFLFSDKMLYGSDTIPDGIYTRQYYKNYHAEFGGIPRWNPFILGGLPFIDAMHGDTFYPAAWLKFFMPLTRALGYKLILHVFLAGIFMYLFLRTLKLRREAAFLGGLMYMLAPSFVSWLYGGHDAKMYVIALLPLAFSFLELGMNKPRFYFFAGLGAVMGLLILSSQIQMAYYAYWAIGLYFIFRLFVPPIDSRGGFAARIGFFVISIIIALTLGSIQLIPSYKFSTSQSVRAGAERTGYEYATSFSMNGEEVASMIVPSFSGTFDGRFNSEDQRNLYLYWGKNFFKINTEYHGIVPLLFALMTLLVCRNRLRWFFLGLAGLSLIYAVGASTPIYRLFYAFVPGIKNFRAPSMMIFLFCFAVVVMASQFISSLLDMKTVLKHGDKRLIYTVGVVVVFAFIISVMGSTFFELWQSIFYKTITDNQLRIMNANVRFFTIDLWRVTVLISVMLLGTWMFLSKRISTVAIVVLIALVAAVDGLYIDSRFVTVIDPISFIDSAPDQTVRELQQKMAENRMPFRVLGLDIFGTKNSSNYYAMFGIQVADGKHNNELQTYDLFKGGRSIENFTSLWIKGNSLNPEGLSQNNFLKVAGIKYIVLPISKGVNQLFENKYAFDRAFIVHDCVTVKNDAEAIEILKDISFNPAQKVIITGDITYSYIDLNRESVIESLTNTKKGVNIIVDFQSPGFLVLTENWVPYWKAEVDGKPVNIHRAYGTFMCVECPEGKHEINFTFQSSPYDIGKKLTLASLAFIIVSLVVTGVSYKIKGKKKIT